MVYKVLRTIACALAVSAVSVLAQMPVDSSLTAYWPFERVVPFATLDESPILNHDTLVNRFDLVGIQDAYSAHLYPGPFGYFLSNDSVGCKFVVRESAGKFNAPSFTFAAFVLIQGPAKTQTLFQNSAAVAGKKAGYLIQVAPDSTVQVIFGDSISGSWNTIATTAKLNSITHIAVTYDGVTVRTYINGSLASSNSYSGSFTPGKGPAIVCGTNIDGQYYNIFKNQIDEIRVYSRAISAAEIWELAHPAAQNVTGCWDVLQKGPDKDYTGEMSLTQASNGNVSGTITWNSPYGSTSVSGMVQGNDFSITGSWTSPNPVTVTYNGTLTTYRTKILNGSSKENGGGWYSFSGSKKVCVIPPPQDTASLCFTTHQEKSPGSGTWWNGTMNVKVLTNGTVIGGTIDWDVPSHGTVTGGTISGSSASINTHNVTYDMDVTYAGTFTPDSNIINGTSNGVNAFNAAKVSCSPPPPPPPSTTTQCWSTRQEKSPGSNTWWTGLLQIVIDPSGNITGGTITWDVPSNGVVTGGSITGNNVSVSTHNITYNMDMTYTGTLSADGNSIINGSSGGTAAFNATKVGCP
jgi:hypothetical protein